MGVNVILLVGGRKNFSGLASKSLGKDWIVHDLMFLESNEMQNSVGK